MTYEHPLAYVLGLEGLALLRAFRGEADREFIEARLAEMRRLLDEPTLQHGVSVDELDTVTGYRAWAGTYDDPDNAVFGIEEPVMHHLLDRLPVGHALDAACGTGRHSHYLAQRGHHVVGVDSSAEMLAQARSRVPGVEYRLGDLERLPVPDAAVDVAVCALALTHLPAVDGPIAELARVLRPGGHLIISDVHHEMVLRGSIPPVEIDGRPGRLPAYRHQASDYLRPALRHGLRLRGCEEPRLPLTKKAELRADPGPWQLWPWSLAALAPDAATTANTDTPAVVIWHFQRDTS